MENNIKRKPKKNFMVGYSTGGFTVSFKNNKGTPYYWSSATRTLERSGSSPKRKVRMSDVFPKSIRRAIKSALPPRSRKNSPQPKNSTNSPNVLTRPQQGGTCWFHAIINGLIMSWKSRQILERYYIPLANTNIGERSLFSTNSCPSKHASGRLFWSYIEHRLSQQKGRVNDRYRNANVIRNLGIRRRGPFPNLLAMVPRIGNTKRTYMRRYARSRSAVFGGTFSDILNVYEKLFPGDYSLMSENKPTAFVITKGKQFKRYIRHAGYEYDLSHGYIQVVTPGSIMGHAMAGYVSRLGNYNMYDSGYGKHFKKEPWYLESEDKHLIQWIRERYSVPVTKVSKWAFYVRRNLIR